MPINKRAGLRAAAVIAAMIGLALAPCQDAAAKQKSSRSAHVTKAKAGQSGSSGRHWSRHSGSGKGSRAARRAPAPRSVEPAPVAAVTPPAAVAAVPASLTGQALVPVAAGGLTSTSARITSDLSAVLDSPDLRVLPLMTQSSLADAIALGKADKADLAFLHADLLATLPEAERSAMASRVTYVARLYNEEVHVIAPRDINSVSDLAGKKVNVGPAGSANAQTAELIFDRLGIAPVIVHLDQPTALAKLAAGELTADVLVAGRPVKALQEFAGDGHFKLLPLPYADALQDLYLPAKIAPVDYGNLVPPGLNVDTLAVPVVLATIDAPSGSPRAARVARFTNAFFERFDELRDPARHPKWREVNLAADVPGWTRFGAAQEALDRSKGRSASAGAAANSSDPRLYGDLTQWTRDTGR